MLLKADGITLKHKRLEREIIPLGPNQIEVEMGEVPIEELRLDPTNPRLAFKIHARELTDPTQKELQDLLWEDPDVTALRRSIAATGGLIEAVIVQADGTVLEGNCRLTCIRKLDEEAKQKDPRWRTIRARILPPGVDRRTIDVLLGELHIAGKNEWTPFEQAVQHDSEGIQGSRSCGDVSAVEELHQREDSGVQAHGGDLRAAGTG